MNNCTGMGFNQPTPKRDPNCTCICHTQPGVMHVADCCRSPMTDKAPEKIWANCDGNSQTWLAVQNVNHDAPYIRLDLHKAEIAMLRAELAVMWKIADDLASYAEHDETCARYSGSEWCTCGRAEVIAAWRAKMEVGL